MTESIPNSGQPTMLPEERLTDQLAARALGWRVAPDRYIQSGRSWTPRSKFRPLRDLKDAFRLLDAVSKDYSLGDAPGRTFTARVRVAGRVGKATGEPKARTISLAIAEALGIDLGATK
jgi:hypothetical protein